MRPTPNKEKVPTTNDQGIELPIDPGVSGEVLSVKEAEVWLEFAAEALKGLCSSTSVTANNPPTFVSDEACLMADRMLLGYRIRTCKK